ncbi:type II toxin-antitoxin system VapC family toxin [Bernardetia sp. OM2101]|uniref:type II toxin-antitoxin system VapC family toxin n=1 Tax=Bernardetia sp. OM2101 TaxID=3344876 RepID=UPI0035CE8C67
MRIFIDTAPFIYLIEANPIFVEKVKNYFIEVILNQEKLVTSVITVMEFGVMPERQGKQETILKFRDFLDSMDISVISINEQISVRAYKLRAKYSFLKGMDALQMAVALEENCEKFLTNDDKLKSVTELEVILIDNL